MEVADGLIHDVIGGDSRGCQIVGVESYELGAVLVSDGDSVFDGSLAGRTGAARPLEGRGGVSLVGQVYIVGDPGVQVAQAFQVSHLCGREAELFFAGKMLALTVGDRIPIVVPEVWAQVLIGVSRDRATVGGVGDLFGLVVVTFCLVDLADAGESGQAEPGDQGHQGDGLFHGLGSPLHPLLLA